MKKMTGTVCHILECSFRTTWYVTVLSRLCITHCRWGAGPAGDWVTRRTRRITFVLMNWTRETFIITVSHQIKFSILWLASPSFLMFSI
jgi:hypothetical protein